MAFVFSKYTSHLLGPTAARYKQKCMGIGSDDPFGMPSTLFKQIRSDSMDDFTTADVPNFTYPDLCNYLIYTNSFYTGDELKAFKSLNAFNQLTQGWLKYLGIKQVIGGRFLIMSKVLHSQSITLPPLPSWIVIEASGTVDTAHCACMAGLGEACTHIATALFAMESLVKYVSEKSCTSQSCYWLCGPTDVGKPAETCNINFSRPSVDSCTNNAISDHIQRHVPLPTYEEKQDMFRKLHATNFKSAVLSVVPGYAQNYAPKAINLNIPKPLSDLYSSSNLGLTFKEVCSKSEELFNNISVSTQQASDIEKETRAQAKSKIWFQQRTGRITASNFKGACKTDPENPSLSLVKRICYPQSYSFTTSATRYGCDHEKDAMEMYTSLMQHDHRDVNVSLCGLIIHPRYPFLGASPDGKVTCDCCGFGLVEIKCPMCLKEWDFNTAMSSKNFCVGGSRGEGFSLKVGHQYYYQMQLQMKLCEASYCDFVIWRENPDKKQQLFVQRISYDGHFIDENIMRVKKFYLEGVLPELICKWHSRHPNTKKKVSHTATVIINYT